MLFSHLADILLQLILYSSTSTDFYFFHIFIQLHLCYSGHYPLIQPFPHVTLPPYYVLPPQLCVYCYPIVISHNMPPCMVNMLCIIIILYSNGHDDNNVDTKWLLTTNIAWPLCYCTVCGQETNWSLEWMCLAMRLTSLYIMQEIRIICIHQGYYV